MSSSKSAKLYYDVDPKTWLFQDPVKNKKQGVNVYINLPKGGNPIFQLEECTAPFGPQKPEGESFRLNLELNVSSPRMRQFALDLDDFMIKHVTQNSELIFKKKLTEDFVREALRTLMSKPEDDKYDPLLRIKLNTETNTAANRTRRQISRNGCYFLRRPT